VIDRDTLNVAGYVPVVDMILKEIDEATVFIFHLTYVGRRIYGRPTPNPNVLIEYRWALKKHGNAFILPVLNIAYALPSPLDMPFDLIHFRHPILFNCLWAFWW
jgi:hypothetical protein